MRKKFRALLCFVAFLGGMVGNSQAAVILKMDFDGELAYQAEEDLAVAWLGKPSFSDGHQGQALDLKGRENGVVINHHSVLAGMEQMTLSVWAKKDVPESTGYLVKKHGHFDLALKKNNTIYAALTNAKGEKVRLMCRRYEGIDNLDWHQYQLSYDGQVVKLLVDGKEVDRQAFSGPINSDARRDLYIGKSPWDTSFSGLIDEFEINDGFEAAPVNFGNEVMVEMGPHQFRWTLSRAVKWGYFIDGQPWVVRPPG